MRLNLFTTWVGLCISVLSFLILFTNEVYPTVVLKMSLKQLVKGSDIILIGTCKSVKSEWNDKKTLIHTYIAISVDKYLKGEERSSSVVIKQIGGVVGDIEQKAVGFPSFKPGEEVLLFLDMRGKNFFRVLGLKQGKYSIYKDPINGEKYIEKNVSGPSLYDIETSKISSSKKGKERLSLEEFQSQILNLLRNGN